MPKNNSYKKVYFSDRQNDLVNENLVYSINFNNRIDKTQSIERVSIDNSRNSQMYIHHNINSRSPVKSIKNDIRAFNLNETIIKDLNGYKKRTNNHRSSYSSKSNPKSRSNTRASNKNLNKVSKLYHIEKIEQHKKILQKIYENSDTKQTVSIKPTTQLYFEDFSGAKNSKPQNKKRKDFKEHFICDYKMIDKSTTQSPLIKLDQSITNNQNRSSNSMNLANRNLLKGQKSYLMESYEERGLQKYFNQNEHNGISSSMKSLFSVGQNNMNMSQSCNKMQLNHIENSNEKKPCAKVLNFTERSLYNYSNMNNNCSYLPTKSSTNLGVSTNNERFFPAKNNKMKNINLMKNSNH